MEYYVKMVFFKIKQHNSTFQSFSLPFGPLIRRACCVNDVQYTIDSSHSADSYFPLEYRSAILMVKNQ